MPNLNHGNIAIANKHALAKFSLEYQSSKFDFHVCIPRTGYKDRPLPSWQTVFGNRATSMSGAALSISPSANFRSVSD